MEGTVYAEGDFIGNAMVVYIDGGSVTNYKDAARAPLTIKRERLDEAIESCRAALRLDKRNVPALGLLATALELNGEVKEAIRAAGGYIASLEDAAGTAQVVSHYMNLP